MKKVLILLVVMLATASSVLSQSGMELDSSSDYVYEPGEIFYIIIQIDQLQIEEIKTELEELKDQPEFELTKVSKLPIKDMTYGDITILVVRRFQNFIYAEYYVEIINKKSIMGINEALIISQINYRKFLKKQDLEEYKNFIEN